MTTDFLRDQEISIIEHPPYSPDLAPADFFLFPQLKKHAWNIRRSTGAPGGARVAQRRWPPGGVPLSEWVRVVGAVTSIYCAICVVFYENIATYIILLV